MCHGKNGDGKGELAAEMKLDLHDWRDPKSIANMTDGELFYVVSDGRGKMRGGEGDRQKEVAVVLLISSKYVIRRTESAPLFFDGMKRTPHQPEFCVANCLSRLLLCGLCPVSRATKLAGGVCLLAASQGR
jgi:hypothetical protein